MVSLDDYVHSVQNFPKPGIDFKDISPILETPAALQKCVLNLANHFTQGTKHPSHVAGIEARGLIFGSLIAYELGLPFVLIRKAGKLPRDVYSQEYDLEYGNARLELHKDTLSSGDKVLIVDDVLATGGTAHAAIKLCEMAGASIVGVGFIMELSKLDGTELLKHYNTKSLLTY